MATATAIKQKEENPMKPTDQQQQPPSDPSSNNNNASSTRQQPPSSTTVTDSYRKDGDESKALATGVLEGSTAVRDDDNVKDEPVSVIQKKIRRAERFGMPVQLSEEEKRNSRAERFGTVSAVHGSDALKKSEEHKRKARAERFGLLQSVPADEEAKKKVSVPADEEAKKKARLARFGALPKTDPLEDDKKKARAIRFSQPPSGSLSQKSGKGNNIETKTAIAGKAGGGT